MAEITGANREVSVMVHVRVLMIRLSARSQTPLVCICVVCVCVCVCDRISTVTVKSISTSACCDFNVGALSWCIGVTAQAFTPFSDAASLSGG
jgi:hypothetical protein